MVDSNENYKFDLGDKGSITLNHYHTSILPSATYRQAHCNASVMTTISYLGDLWRKFNIIKRRKYY